MFKSILVPVDLFELDVTKPAIDKAIALSMMTGASLHLVYVRSIIPVTFMEYVPPSFDEEQQVECEERMASFIASLALTNKNTVTSAIRMGAVYNEVLSEAEKQACDLIVVGSHHPSMATYLLGSDAATIVRHAPCSVLVVRV